MKSSELVDKEKQGQSDENCGLSQRPTAGRKSPSTVSRTKSSRSRRKGRGVPRLEEVLRPEPPGRRQRAPLPLRNSGRRASFLHKRGGSRALVLNQWPRRKLKSACVLGRVVPRFSSFGGSLQDTSFLRQPVFGCRHDLPEQGTIA